MRNKKKTGEIYLAQAIAVTDRLTSIWIGFDHWNWIHRWQNSWYETDRSDDVVYIHCERKEIFRIIEQSRFWKKAIAK